MKKIIIGILLITICFAFSGCTKAKVSEKVGDSERIEIIKEELSSKYGINNAKFKDQAELFEKMYKKEWLYHHSAEATVKVKHGFSYTYDFKAENQNLKVEYDDAYTCRLSKTVSVVQKRQVKLVTPPKYEGKSVKQLVSFTPAEEGVEFPAEKNIYNRKCRENIWRIVSYKGHYIYTDTAKDKNGLDYQLVKDKDIIGLDQEISEADVTKDITIDGEKGKIYFTRMGNALATEYVIVRHGDYVLVAQPRIVGEREFSVTEEEFTKAVKSTKWK